MIKDMMEQLAGGGWADLDNIGDNFKKITNAQGKAEREEIERQAAIVAGALSTVDGKALIELLVNITVLRQEADAELGANTAEAYAIAKSRRAGQNSIVFFLLARLQQHRGQQVVKQPGGEL